MRTIVRGKNLEVPDRVRQYAERKFARLDRLFDDQTNAVVELSNEAHRSASDAHIADVTMVVDGRTMRSRAAGGSYQAALDTVVDKVERQAIDHKEKPRIRARPEQEKAILRKIADGTAEPGHERQIVKTKRFAIEPMFEEDAIARMEELGHQFFVYVDARPMGLGRGVGPKCLAVDDEGHLDDMRHRGAPVRYDRGNGSDVLHVALDATAPRSAAAI